jgi:DNA repair protein RecO
MQPQRVLAIVLRSIPYQERHRIVTALTAELGQVSAIAKNSIQSRRFGGTLDIFAASEWIYTQRPGAEMIQISEAQIRTPFEGIRKDFQRLSLASALNEIMLKLAPQNHPADDLFRLHSNALFLLNEMPEIEVQGLYLLNSYMAKLLQWSGNQPRLSGCMQCGMLLESLALDAEISCLLMDAGWVCPQCRTHETRHIRERDGRNLQHSLLRLTRRAVQDFQRGLSIPIRQVPFEMRASVEEHQQLFQFLEALFIYHIPGFDQKPLKSLRFLGLKSNMPLEAVYLQ